MDNFFLKINDALPKATPPPPPPLPPAVMTANMMPPTVAATPAAQPPFNVALTGTLQTLSNGVGNGAPVPSAPPSPQLPNAFPTNFWQANPVEPPSQPGPNQNMPANFWTANGVENPAQPPTPPFNPPFLSTPADLVRSISDTTNIEFGDLVNEGSIPQRDGRQTHHFNTHAEPGDGLIVAEFVIQEETSGFILEGDGRPLNDDPLQQDPATPDYDLNDSRMLLVIDRETGRGAITVTSTHAIFPVDFDLISPFSQPYNNSGIPYVGPDLIDIPIAADTEVGARPIEIGANGIGDFVPNDVIPKNYFDIQADADSIRVEYDAVNSVTAFLHQISVDGPIVLERGPEGTFVTADGHDPDLYPAISVVQYPTEGDRVTVYFEEGKNVFEGASPVVAAEAFEAVREISEEPIEAITEIGGEFAEGWNEVGDAPFYRVPDQLGEAALEIAYETVEGTVEVVVDVPWEIAEGTVQTGWAAGIATYNAISFWD